MDEPAASKIALMSSRVWRVLQVLKTFAPCGGVAGADRSAREAYIALARTGADTVNLLNASPVRTLL